MFGDDPEEDDKDYEDGREPDPDARLKYEQCEQYL